MTHSDGELNRPEGPPSQGEPEGRKPYQKPEVLYDLPLETRAGSPLNLPDPLDPAGNQP